MVEKRILGLTTTALILVTFLLSISFPNQNSLYLYLLIFSLIHWQRGRLLKLDKITKGEKSAVAICLLTGWFWAILLEFCLGRLSFHPRPLMNFLVGAGFYLPYFAIWLKLVKKYQFTFFEIFYLSGLAGLIFDALITRKLFIPLATYQNPTIAFIAIFARAIASVTLFGILTTLPYLYLTTDQKAADQKPLKEYLVGMTPIFFATGALLLWIAFIKLVFLMSIK